MYHGGELPLALSDLPLDELVRYLPTVSEPDDFDDFWQRTLTEARAYDLNVISEQVDTPYRTVTVYDVAFSGYAGDRISAWLTTPRGSDGPLRAVVEFVGYGGGRDLPGASLWWASAGYAHLLTGQPRSGAPAGAAAVTPRIRTAAGPARPA